MTRCAPKVGSDLLRHRRAIGLLVGILLALLLLDPFAHTDAADFIQDEGAVGAAVGKIAGKVRAFSVEIEPTTVSVIAEDPRHPGEAAEWRLQRGLFGRDRLSGPATANATLPTGRLDDSLFDLGLVDFTIAPQLIAKAKAYAALEDAAVVTRIEIARVTHMAAPGTYRPGEVRWTVAVRSARESADIVADVDGSILGGKLAGTHRAKTLDIFAKPELVQQAVDTARDVLGSGPIFTSVAIRTKEIVFQMLLPQGTSSDPATAMLASRTAVSGCSSAMANGGRLPANPMNTLARVDREFGAGARYAEIQFGRDGVAIVATDPQAPTQLISVVLADGGFQRRSAGFMISASEFFRAAIRLPVRTNPHERADQRGGHCRANPCLLAQEIRFCADAYRERARFATQWLCD